MRSGKNPNPYLDAFVSNMASSAGGVIAGLTIGGVSLGPTGAIVGSGIGAALAAAAIRAKYSSNSPTIMDRLRQYFLVRNLLKNKLYDDLRLSFLDNPDKFKAESTRIRQQIREAGILTGLTDKRLPDEDWNCHERIEELEKRKIINESVKVLQKYGRITIALSSIMTGAVSALKQVKDHHNLDLEIRFDEACGRTQIGLIESYPNEFDFHIIPSDPVFLNDPKITDHYTFVGPIHGEVQRVFQKKSLIEFSQHSAIWAYSQSACEMQFKLGIGVPRQVEMKPLDTFSSIPQILPELPSGDYVVLWNPVANALADKHGLVYVQGSEYCVTYCLFVNRRFRRSPEIKEAFKRIFRYEFLRCRSNPRKAENILRKDNMYMTRFAEGCGLIWTSELGS